MTAGRSMNDSVGLDLDLLPLDISAYRRGNTGIDYVHRIDSGTPGPEVLVNGLTHGNEFCGAYAVAQLLESDVRPRVGTLTLSLANVEAYESFDAANPFASRQLVHNMNRIWSPHWLDSDLDSPELRRARELRPIVADAQHILDIHSTAQPMPPFWVLPNRLANIGPTQHRFWTVLLGLQYWIPTGSVGIFAIRVAVSGSGCQRSSSPLWRRTNPCTGWG